MAGRHRTRRHKALQGALRALRKNAQLTQTELAELLGKPQSYVSKYEIGERKLDLPELHKICETLGIELETLVRRYKKALQ